MKPFVLCGPTASGKTELALELARKTGGAVLSADSRQVYKRLTVGTAKPAGAWQNGLYWVDGVAYHLVDFLDVTDGFNAGAFCARAREILSQNAQKPVIFAGGTGMYLQALFVGMDELPAGTPQTRAALQKRLEEEGKEGLHRSLQEIDPASAALIPPGNVQRTMRALELYMLTGKPASQLKSGHFFKLPDPQHSFWVYLCWDKDALNERIARRTEAIFDGMAEETRTLLAEGYSEDTPALKSLGYPQAVSFLRGELSRAQAVEKITALTRQYAKRQRTWFNRYTNAFKIELARPEDFDVKKITREILSRAEQRFSSTSDTPY